MKNSISVEDARKVLGKTSESLSDSQVSDLILLFDEIADKTLETYQTKIFGKPLKQLLTKSNESN